MVILKPGRNDPCPCGSGKKYKKCCQEKFGPAPSAADSNRGRGPGRAECDQLFALYQAGRHAELEDRSRSLAEQFPGSGIVWKVLGVARQAQGKEALAALRKAATLLPDDAETHSNLGMACKDLGQLDKAAASFRRALALKPDYADAHYNLGNTLHALGQLDQAVASYHRALKTKPDFAATHNNLGNALYDSGKLDEAVASFHRALAIKPDYAEAHNNLGNALLDLGQLDEAVASYHRALAIKPDYAEAHNNLGNALRELGRLSEALASCRRALEIKPDYAEAHDSLGVVLMEMSQVAEATSSFREAFRLKPALVNALASLCDILERLNKTEELRDCLANVADSQVMSHSGLVLIKAKLLRREKKFAEASALLLERSASTATSRSGVAGEIFAVHGDLHDRLHEYAQAFECFQKSKSVAAKIYARQGFDKQRYLGDVQHEADYLNETLRAGWASPPFDPCKLVFLVGFPRSGTTLLDSILRSHPFIDVIEEEPMLSLAASEMRRRESATPGYLERLDAAELASLRQVYFDELRLHRDLSHPDALVIDKLPLNIMLAGRIRVLFPEARFIFALRDPRDCVLSCFMQSFAPNNAMANFLTLEDAAGLYDKVMRLWQDQQKLLQLPVQRVRYEDIVTDFEPTVRSLLAFLDLPWDDAVSSFQKTAMERKKISTPSYHQVVQPLYKSASGRWKNYRAQMEPVLPVLQPWATLFGYE